MGGGLSYVPLLSFDNVELRRNSIRQENLTGHTGASLWLYVELLDSSRLLCDIYADVASNRKGGGADVNP